MLALPGARVVAGKPALWQMAVYYAVILMVFLLWKQYGKWQILCLYVIGILCLFWRPLEGNGVSVTVLDVGQGDSIFIRGPDGGAYLVDGGSSDVGIRMGDPWGRGSSEWSGGAFKTTKHRRQDQSVDTAAPKSVG